MTNRTLCSSLECTDGNGTRFRTGKIRLLQNSSFGLKGSSETFAPFRESKRTGSETHDLNLYFHIKQTGKNLKTCCRKRSGYRPIQPIRARDNRTALLYIRPMGAGLTSPTLVELKIL